MATRKDYVSVPDSELPPVPQSSVAGGVNPNEVADVVIRVRSSSSADPIDALVEQLAGASVGERQYLTADEFASSQSADPDDLEAVVRFANSNNLSVASISPAQRMVRVTGKLIDLSKAFDVPLKTYRSPRGTYRAHIGSVNVPLDLADVVSGVFGLDTTPQSTFHLRKAPAVKALAAGVSAPWFTPTELANLYNFPAGVNGEGQTIGIIEFGGGYRMSDLDTYFQSLGVPTPNVVSVSVGGASNSPSNPNSPDAEVMLDIEVAGAIAPGAQIVVYFAPNTTLGWLRAIATAIHDSFHQPSVISISWGGPEKTWTRQALRACNFEFIAAAALGITICGAAGDNGYTDGVPGSAAHVDFPASSPYVLACGGTSLKSSEGSISSETVWNDGPNHANPSSSTGGGSSAFFRVPYYQNAANISPAWCGPLSATPPSNPGRGVPDVAGNADPNTGYRVRVDGTEQIIGGTSAVAPLWAGLIALINEKLGKPCGFINPLLYNQGVAGGALNDIVTGNNGGYRAGPGWDACTGLGSPNGMVLSNIL
jgi:kumamolisin